MNRLRVVWNAMKMVWNAMADEKAFIETAYQLSIAENPDLDRDRHNGDIAERRRGLRNRYCNSLMITVLALAFGTILSFLLPVSSFYGAVCIVAGTLIILWSTLAVLGEVQTFGGESPIEQVNRWLFKSAYFVGTLLIVYGTLSTATAAPSV